MAAKIQGLNAFKDNYIWLLYDLELGVCICIDPGDATPVKRFIEKTGCRLSHILVTHHHWDHTNGVKNLANQYQCQVIGPKSETILAMTDPVQEGDQITIDGLDLTFYVINTPGHTQGHIAYYGHGMLFCGDTLFTGGCGRLFEGTAEQMQSSLDKLMQLPPQTRVYCAHEYTVSNLRFAQLVEPYNPALIERLQQALDLRRHNQPTVPSTLAEEMATNPFLRTRDRGIITSAEQKCGRRLETPADVLAAIRQWKDNA